MRMRKGGYGGGKKAAISAAAGIPTRRAVVALAAIATSEIESDPRTVQGALESAAVRSAREAFAEARRRPRAFRRARRASSRSRSPPPPSPRQSRNYSAGVQTVAVTADENNMRVDRFFEARFPGLSFSHIQRIIRKGEVRVNGKRTEPKARLEAGQTVRIPPLQLEAPKAARRRAASAQGPRVHPLDHAVRRRRRAGAQQAGRARRAGRLRREGEHRRHARRLARHASGRASVRAWCIGSTRTPPAACWWPRPALPRRRWPRPSARARRARSIGRWSPACRSRSRAASRPISPSRRARRIRSCASPSMARRTPCTRSPITPWWKRRRRSSPGFRSSR